MMGEDDEIIGVGYRRLPGVRARRWAPWPIARTALALALRRRSTKAAAALCAMVVIVTAVVLFTQVIVGRVAEMMADSSPMAGMVERAAKTIVGETHEALSGFIASQMFCTAILVGVAIGGIVADDRRTGAFELYFSRPLSRLDYATGKLLAAALIPIATILVPFVLLWLAVVGATPPEVSAELLGLIVPGLIGAGLATVLLATTIVGVSAIGERGRTVAVLYVTTFVVLAAAGSGLTEAGYSAAGYLAPQRDIQSVSDALLGVGGISMTASYLGVRHDTNPSAWLSAVALLGFSALGLGAFIVQLRKRVIG